MPCGSAGARDRRRSCNPGLPRGLTTGSRLEPNEIVAPLGSGGMGEVYRARDSRFGRDVAVKVLPAGVARPQDFYVSEDLTSWAFGYRQVLSDLYLVEGLR